MVQVNVEYKFLVTVKHKLNCCLPLIFQDTDYNGYKGHVLCVEAFNKALKLKEVFPNANKEIRILDAGAGTGIIGKMLVDLGYKNIDGLDISQKMLDLAAPKNVYKESTLRKKK